MSTKTTYEWCVETLDEHQDIVDLRHEDKLSNFVPSHLPKAYGLCLIRNTHDTFDGELMLRLYAYAIDGKLMTNFCDGTQDDNGQFHPNGYEVPKRFIEEFERYKENFDVE